MSCAVGGSLTQWHDLIRSSQNLCCHRADNLVNIHDPSGILKRVDRVCARELRLSATIVFIVRDENDKHNLIYL